MEITIKGIKDESYVTKENVPVVQVRVSFTRSGVDGWIGEFCDNELITFRRCPGAVDTLLKLGDKAKGLKAYMSKDVSKFGGQSYSYVDSFDILQ